MYTVEVFSSFSSAHKLRGYKGKCENIHGHNWKVGVNVSSNGLSEIGIVVDFKEMKKLLKEVLQELDHKDLNDIEYFKKVNPTSENLAKYVYDELKKKGLAVASISVWEADDSKATYSGV